MPPWVNYFLEKPWKCTRVLQGRSWICNSWRFEVMFHDNKMQNCCLSSINERPHQYLFWNPESLADSVNCYIRGNSMYFKKCWVKTTQTSTVTTWSVQGQKVLQFFNAPSSGSFGFWQIITPCRPFLSGLEAWQCNLCSISLKGSDANQVDLS